MRALVIGRGSMGKRRIRDLTTLGVEVESWDKTDPINSGFDVRNYGAVVISTPPMTKLDPYAVLCAGSSVPFFTEADVMSISFPHFPSATPLFTDWYAEIQRWAYMAGYILHVGQHIDDWHPGADPETYYAYQLATGPTREMIPFELIWLTQLFGPVTHSAGYGDKNVASVTVRHRYGVTGTIVIDALSRPAVRRFTGIGYAGWQRSLDLTYDEDVYYREMGAFIAAVKGEAPWPYSQAEEAANLEVLHMIERSD